MSKICTICKEEKLLDQFKKTKAGYLKKICSPCDNKRAHDYDAKNWENRMVRGAKYIDKKKKRNNKNIVTKKYIQKQHKLQNNKCFYCDCEMKYGIGVSRECSTGITLERISSDLPHINSNCVLICHECNTMKSSVDFRKFIEKCTHISNKFKYVFD